MTDRKIVIAIDGPAGVGKSSVGRQFAQSIGYKFISSGKMYRALAYMAIKKGISVQDEKTSFLLLNHCHGNLRKSMVTNQFFIWEDTLLRENYPMRK